MIRVLKTDIFRAVRTKMFYVFPIFMVLFQVAEFLLQAVKTETETGETGPVLNEFIFSAPDLFSRLGDGMIMLFLGLFLAAFCNDESKNGFCKNVVGRVADRAYMPVSKMIVGTLALFVYIAEAIVIRTGFVAMQFAFAGKKLVWTALPDADKKGFITFLVLCIIGHIAFAAFLVLSHELLHSRAFGMVFAFLFSTAMLDQLLFMLQEILKSQFGILKDVELGKYLMVTMMSEGWKSPLYSSGRLFLIAMIIGIPSAVAAIAVARKKDVS